MSKNSKWTTPWKAYKAKDEIFICRAVVDDYGLRTEHEKGFATYEEAKARAKELNGKNG